MLAVVVVSVFCVLSVCQSDEQLLKVVPIRGRTIPPHLKAAHEPLMHFCIAEGIMYACMIY